MRKICTLIFIAFSLTAGAQNYAQQLRTKALTLRRFLELNHYQPLQWNDSASLRLYNRWMGLLDDEKMIFTKSDIEQLQAWQTKLDDEMMGREWGFFDKCCLLYKKRLAEADSCMNVVLSKPIDFSKPDNIVQPFTAYAANVQELQQRWQKFMKWRVLRTIASSVVDTATNQQYLTKIPAGFSAAEIKTREKLKRQFAINFKELLSDETSFVKDMADMYLDAIAWCYDPHSNYMNLGSKKEFDSQKGGFEYSAGMDVKKDEDGSYEIEYLEPGGSAWRSGELHTGDIIIKIKKGNEAVKELADMDEDDVAELLQGSSDDKIEVTIRTAGGTQKTVTLKKEKISDDESIVKSYLLRGEKNIGYIDLPGFYSRESDEAQTYDDVTLDGCANDVSKEIVKLKRDSIAGLILDLRYNGGGSMWEAMQLAGIFIDMGPVASVKEKDGKVRFLKDPNRGTIYDGPLLILINGKSASASELTAAVLQDYNRALIAGSTTYGKGSAQVVSPMDTTIKSLDEVKSIDKYEDFVKVTERKFYRVDGNTTQWKGVIPDIALPEIVDLDDHMEKDQASALLPDQSKKAFYQPLPVIPVTGLKVKSTERINIDPGFAAIKKYNEWINQRGVSRDIPLQWQPYVALYKKGTDLFAEVEEAEDSIKKKFTVVNNNFDGEKLKFSSDTGKEINNSYLERVESDSYIIEAYNILIDWIKQ